MFLILLILFALLASPQAFRAVRNVLGSWVASAEGLPTFAGLAVHAFVFVLILGLVKRRMGLQIAKVPPTYDPSVSRATDYGSNLAAKGPDAVV
jgi:hypothetical protein